MEHRWGGKLEYKYHLLPFCEQIYLEEINIILRYSVSLSLRPFTT